MRVTQHMEMVIVKYKSTEELKLHQVKLESEGYTLEKFFFSFGFYIGLYTKNLLEGLN